MLINVIDAGAGRAVGFDLGLSIKSGLISILGVSPSYIPLLIRGGRGEGGRGRENGKV